MGFRYEPRTLLVEFSDPQMQGLEMRARPLTIDELLAVVRLEAAAAVGEPDEVEELLGRFLDTITSWNLEDDAGPVPLTREAVGAMDHAFVKSLIRGWMRAVTAVPDPLDGRSDSGATSLEASLPMDPL